MGEEREREIKCVCVEVFVCNWSLQPFAFGNFEAFFRIDYPMKPPPPPSPFSLSLPLHVWFLLRCGSHRRLHAMTHKHEHSHREDSAAHSRHRHHQRHILCALSLPLLHFRSANGGHFAAFLVRAAEWEREEAIGPEGDVFDITHPQRHRVREAIVV
jgi:hypothetical protein